MADIVHCEIWVWWVHIIYRLACLYSKIQWLKFGPLFVELAVYLISAVEWDSHSDYLACQPNADPSFINASGRLIAHMPSSGPCKSLLFTVLFSQWQSNKAKQPRLHEAAPDYVHVNMQRTNVRLATCEHWIDTLLGWRTVLRYAERDWIDSDL